MVSMFVAAVMLPREEPVTTRQAVSDTHSLAGNWAAIKQVVTPLMIALFLMIFIMAFGLAGFESIYSLFVNEVHHFSLQAIALVLTLNGIVSLILQVFCFNRLVQWLGEIRLVRYCFFGSAIATIFVIYDHSHWQLIVATLVVFEAFDMLRPAITTLLTKLSQGNQGLLNGINMSLTSVGNIVGPLMSGALLDVNYLWPYWVVFAFLMVSFLLTFVLQKMQHGDVTESISN